MTLPDQLRAAIAAEHTAIERTPLASAMMKSSLTRSHYGWWLTQMQALHAAVESAVANVPFFETHVLIRAMDRSQDVEADIQALNDTGVHLIHPAVETLLADMAEWATSTPWKLLGTIYVLEGSRMGSLMLVKPIARALGVPVELGVGVDYHLVGADQRPRLWQQFRGELSAMVLTAEQCEDVKAAAVATMSTLRELYSHSPVLSDEPCGAVAHLLDSVYSA